MNRHFLFAIFYIISNSLVAQDLSNFNPYYNLQFNPAYAGQDTNHTFILGAEFTDELLKPEDERISGTPYTIQFAYSGNFKKFKSGIGLIGKLSAIGSMRVYEFELLYNFNVKIDENSNFRFGIAWKESFLEITNDLYHWQNEDSGPLSMTDRKSNGDIGAWYSLRKLNIGLAVKNVLDNNSNVRYYNLLIHDEFGLTDNIKTIPSFLLLHSSYDNNFILMNYFSFFDTYLFGAGLAASDFKPVKGSLLLGIGARASRKVQIMLGYSDPIKIRGFKTLSIMAKVSLY